MNFADIKQDVTLGEISVRAERRANKRMFVAFSLRHILLFNQQGFIGKGHENTPSLFISYKKM